MQKRVGLKEKVLYGMTWIMYPKICENLYFHKEYTPF